MFLFGKRKTPREILRENQRLIRRSQREIDRERVALQRQEKQITVEIKQMAKQNQMASARILARDLVRTRNNIQKFYRLRSQLQAVSLRLQTLQSVAAMNDAMKGVTKAMMRMNKSVNLPALQRIMMEFERQSGIMDMKEEMMNDVIDDMADEEEAEEESDEIINQVLDEIGINLSTQLVDAPSDAQKVASPQQSCAREAALEAADMDLQARLNNLRNG